MIESCLTTNRKTRRDEAPKDEKKKEDHANRAGLQGRPKGQESQERERVQEKRETKPTVGRLEEKHGVGETFSEEHAEYDRIAEPQENATATPWRQRKTKKT